MKADDPRLTAECNECGRCPRGDFKWWGFEIGRTVLFHCPECMDRERMYGPKSLKLHREGPPERGGSSVAG